MCNMKRFLVVVIFAILSCTSFAQSNHRLGFVFGPNHFSLRGSDFLDEAKSDYGYFFGFSYEYKFNKNLSLVTGITIEQKRINYNTQFDYDFFNEQGEIVTHDYSVETKNKYQYFSLPLLLKYNFGKDKSFFVNGGLFIATSGKHKKSTKTTNETLGYSYTPTTGNYNFPFADDIEGFDYGVSLGIGKSFKLNSKTNVSVELRDNFGLVNIIQDFDESELKSTMKTNTLILMIQLSYDL